MTRRTAWGAYTRITAALRQRIKDGTYAPDTRLPSEAALCAEFGVARNTVRRALSTLQDEGLITVRPGVGRCVQNDATQPRTRSEDIAAHLRHQIESGHFQLGDALPSEAQLSRRYGVSRSTARTALQALEAADLVTCVHGKGRYVRQDVPR
ncbi:winged helix-turn-helix domain-containing protein [Actinomadura sp. 7K534]|uniref:winged helix-turn-helix domain-containing protein n=1 Tax=Actinomadura sp. 7K534 TaxID=2530366 RepID=UPI00104C512B|nr:winged helix-turn-helix domain-containing protein [Actinomadura sp. 7K534]TDB95354.1 GntR family transcriptional regulator [Actinomadura sp. 7K534]